MQNQKKSGVCFEKKLIFRFLLQVCDEIRINIPDLGRVYGHRQKLNRTVGTTTIPQWTKIRNSIRKLFLEKQDIFQSFRPIDVRDMYDLIKKSSLGHYWQFTVEDSKIIFGFSAKIYI